MPISLNYLHSCSSILPSKSRAIMLSILNGSPSAIVDGQLRTKTCKRTQFVNNKKFWLAVQMYNTASVYQTGFIQGVAPPPLHDLLTCKLILNTVMVVVGWKGKMAITFSPTINA